MLTYRNRLSDILLPFTLPVPFPIGYITHISICVSDKLPVYVTSITSRPDLLVVSVAASSQGDDSQEYSCVFIYNKDLLIKSTHLNGISGVLTLAHLPDLTFQYTGKWAVHLKYINVVRDISSYTSIKVNNLIHKLLSVLNITFRGYVLTSGTDVIRTLSLSFGVPTTTTAGINAVNNVSTLRLYIKSADPSIIIADTPVVTDNAVILYINTQDQFPTCLRSK